MHTVCIWKNVANNSHLHRIGNWDNIWRLKVSPKVKNLIWRICRGCLPTRARLLDKGVNCTSLCGLCDESYEDTIHVLFDCPRARNVWQHSLLWSKVYLVMQNNNTVADIIFALLRELTQDQSQMFATLLWSIWKSRNLRVWQNTTETTQAIAERARFLLYNCQSANKEKQRGTVAGASVVQPISIQAAGTAGNAVLPVQNRWQKPLQGRLKCDVDAAFSETLNCVGFGLCIRDEFGEFIKAKTLWSNPICSSDIGEALGLSHAIQWVHELQLPNVYFELDAKKFVDYFNRGRNDISEFGAIVDECKRRCSVYFENSKMEFNRRQASVVAHTLVRETTLLASPHVFDDVPLCISTLINYFL